MRVELNIDYNRNGESLAHTSGRKGLKNKRETESAVLTHIMLFVHGSCQRL